MSSPPPSTSSSQFSQVLTAPLDAIRSIIHHGLRRVVPAIRPPFVAAHLIQSILRLPRPNVVHLIKVDADYRVRPFPETLN